MGPIIVLLAEAAEALLVEETAAAGLGFTRASITAMRWGATSVRSIQALELIGEFRPVHPQSISGETVYLGLIAGELMKAVGIVAQYSKHKQGASPKFDPAVEADFNALCAAAILATYQGANELNTRDIVATFASEFGRAWGRSPYNIDVLIDYTLNNIGSELRLSEPLYDLATSSAAGELVARPDRLLAHGMTKAEMTKIIAACGAKIGVGEIARAKAHVTTTGKPLSSKTWLMKSLLGQFITGYLSVRGSVRRSVSVNTGKDALSFSTALIAINPSKPIQRMPNIRYVSLTNEMVRAYNSEAAARSRFMAGGNSAASWYDIPLERQKQQTKEEIARNQNTLSTIIASDAELSEKDKASLISSLVESTGRTAVTSAARAKLAEYFDSMAGKRKLVVMRRALSSIIK